MHPCTHLNSGSPLELYLNLIYTQLEPLSVTVPTQWLKQTKMQRQTQQQRRNVLETLTVWFTCVQASTGMHMFTHSWEVHHVTPEHVKDPEHWMHPNEQYDKYFPRRFYLTHRYDAAQTSSIAFKSNSILHRCTLHFISAAIIWRS